MHKPRVSGSGVAGTDDYGVAIESNVNAWARSFLPPEPTPFDSFDSRRSYIEVFAGGTRPIDFTIEADRPWTKVTEGASQRPDRPVLLATTRA